MPFPAQQQQQQFSPGINPSPSSSSSTSPLLMNSSSFSSSLFLHDGCSSSSSTTSALTDFFIPNEILRDVIDWITWRELGNGLSLVDRRHYALAHPKMHEEGAHWIEQIFIFNTKILIQSGSSTTILPLHPLRPLPKRILGIRAIVLKGKITEETFAFLRCLGYAGRCLVNIEDPGQFYQYVYADEAAQHMMPAHTDQLFGMAERIRIDNIRGQYLFMDELLRSHPSIRQIHCMEIAHWDDCLVEWLLQDDGLYRTLFVELLDEFNNFPPELHNAAVKDLCADSKCRYRIKFNKESHFPINDHLDFTNAANGERLRTIESDNALFVIKSDGRLQIEEEEENMEAFFGATTDDAEKMVVVGHSDGSGPEASGPFRLSFSRRN